MALRCNPCHALSIDLNEKGFLANGSTFIAFMHIMALSATDILEAAALALIFTLTIVGNLAVSIVLIKYRRMFIKNRPTYQFILNMVLSDLLVGLLTMPFEFISLLLNEWTFGRTACKIIEFIEIAVLGTAVFTHALIAFDRYRSLAHPYLPKMETRLVKKLIILSWAFPAFVSCPYLYMFEISQTNSNKACTPNSIPIQWLDTLYEAVEFVTIRMIPFVVLWWCYFHVARTMCGVSPTVSVTDGVTRVSVIFQSKRRVTRTAGMVATAFTLCWLPTFIMIFVRLVSGTDRVHRGHVLFEIAMFGAFINEAVNPIIIVSRGDWLGKSANFREICYCSSFFVVTWC